MSFLKDFDDLKLGSRWTVLNIVSTIPFFFVIFYLFNQGRIKLVEGNPFGDIDFYYILAVCFCLSIVWFMVNYFISSVLVSIFESVDEKITPTDEKKENSEMQSDEEFESYKHGGKDLNFTDEDDELHDEFIMTYIYSILYLAIVIFANHMWFKWSFKYAIIATFCFILFRALLVLILDIIVANALKKLEKKS